MGRTVVTALVIAYVPGALIFRLPIADRSTRASLPAEERVFWSILLSVAWSSCLCLGLAAAGRYRFDRVLWISGAVSLLILLLVRGRLQLGTAARYPTWTALLPLGLVALGLWVNYRVPPSEFVIGGKDPGVYINEGIQIAQRGTLVISDEIVAAVPPVFRDLFFPDRGDPTYYINRFMGFFLLDPTRGTVVGQFPHLYPIWIAVAYGVDGLNGARGILGLWGILGLLAVYFLGSRVVGRAAAAAGAGLLAVNVVQVWYARYPNAELVMQPLVFAGLLAYVRADEDRFFAPIAALLFVLSAFAHLTGAFAIAAIAAAAVLGRLGGQRLRASFAVPLAVGTCLVVAYMAAILPPYFAVPVGFVDNLRPEHMALLGVVALAGFLVWRVANRPAVADRFRLWFPVMLVATVWLGAAYGFFWRSAGNVLAAHDAESLRTFTWFYLSPYGLAAALAGFAIVARRSFKVAAPFLIAFTVFSFFFFYKIRIVPEHFWAARRFLAVILPGALLLVGAAAFADVRFVAGGRFGWLNLRRVHMARYAVGLVFVLLLGRHFLGATQPILRHVEYAGLIPRLEQLATRLGDKDLVLVESRGASDVHVLALPLAYIYARNVLVLATTNPDKQAFRDFLTWAHARYQRVFFIGGGGTELLSRTMTVASIGGERFQVPEYESAWNAYPRRVRFKEFDFGLSELLPGPAEATGFDLDVGAADDLYVRHFHAKEHPPNGAAFRWTREVSYVSIVGTRSGQQRLTLWLGNGGRPPAAGAATVEVFLNDQALGEVTVGGGMGPYRFAIPADLATAIAASDEAAQLRLVTRTWNPARVLGGGDTRELGVMVDRVEIR